MQTFIVETVNHGKLRIKAKQMWIKDGCVCFGSIGDYSTEYTHIFASHEFRSAVITE